MKNGFRGSSYDFEAQILNDLPDWLKTLTPIPPLVGTGFILVGLGEIFAAPTLYFKAPQLLRIIGGIVLMAAALIFAFIGLSSYWAHLANFSTWQP